ncbi:class I SAM-dependent methyltransferase [uncultured Campylobacter sp.]|uniref:class I SAM-dependent methyltransferase n=1 Tax=uncultured Campylobacter sp. TaxID=218934 RepID=UPI00261C91BD|nr:class I SAM-dependent methyltransferase [uncultured Campylobacter sp.]
MKKVNFDEYSKDYDAIMQNQHKNFGDIKYYAEYKIKILSNIVKRDHPHLHILEYGCGIGRNLPYIARVFRKSSIFGFDISKESLEIAKQNNKEISIIESEEKLMRYNGCFDVIFIAGVYHHIEPSLRNDITLNIFKLAADNCDVIVFEHNPYNPLTRYMVSTCEFDNDAVLLSKRELQTIFMQAGFKKNASAYTLFFPPILKRLSFLEKFIKWLPLGGQYYISVKKHI